MSAALPGWATMVLALGLAAAQAEDGRALYHGHRPFAAGRNATASRLPPAFTACAGCHGALAEGGSEGGLAAPALRWEALTAPRAGQPAYASETAVRAAIQDGTGRDLRPLASGMPRYRLEEQEAAALLAYLHRAGTADDRPPGVEDGVLRLGTVLPLSGRAAGLGRSVRQGLEEVFAAAPPVHGRQILLLAEDGAALPPAEAMRPLLAQPVYALVAGLWPQDAAAEALLADARTPHIASLVARVRSDEAGPWSADLLPSREAQQAFLARAMRVCDEAGPHLALQVAPPAGEAGSGFQETRWFAESRDLLTALPAIGPAGCLGFGFAGLAGLTGRAPAGWRRLLVLPMPASVATPDGATAATADLWRSLGQAAARLALELLARAGPVLHERALLLQLANSAGFEPLPGAPVRFSRFRRHGWDPGIIELPQAATPAGAPAPAPDPRERSPRP